MENNIWLKRNQKNRKRKKIVENIVRINYFGRHKNARMK